MDKLKTNTPAVTLWYDTNCNLCLRYVRFIKWADTKRVTALRSIYEHESLRSDTRPGSILLGHGSETLSKSDSVLTHWKLLRFPVNILGYIGYIIPRFLRDKTYDFVARNRYKWFGTCNSSK